MTPDVAFERCRRCGSKIRNERKVCPSCGMDLAAPQAEPAPATDEGAQSGLAMRRKVAAKAGVKICAVCLASVPEEQIVDQDGQQVCPSCAENLRQKALRKGAPPTEGAPHPQPAKPAAGPAKPAPAKGWKRWLGGGSK